jgi:hypothetical protein
MASDSDKPDAPLTPDQKAAFEHALKVLEQSRKTMAETQKLMERSKKLIEEKS